MNWQPILTKQFSPRLYENKIIKLLREGEVLFLVQFFIFRSAKPSSAN